MYAYWPRLGWVFVVVLILLIPTGASVSTPLASRGSGLAASTPPPHLPRTALDGSPPFRHPTAVAPVPPLRALPDTATPAPARPVTSSTDRAQSNTPYGVDPGLSSALLPSAFPLLYQSDPAAPSNYPSTPAPMGLSDLGMGSAGPYEYEATSFHATLTLTSFAAYTPGLADWAESPQWVTISLDTVAVDLPVNGTHAAAPAGTFWTENAVRFNGTELEFEDNIWNFSAPNGSVAEGTFVPGTPLSSWGWPIDLNGTYVTDQYYQHWGPSYRVSFPFQLTLTNTLGSSAGRPMVSFNYSVSAPALEVNGTYDQVTFNRTGAATEPPRFAVNGSGVNPYGLRDDAEFVFEGDGTGSNGDLADLNGTATLDEGTGGQYIPVPSAYDYGEDSGGTSAGVAAYYLGSVEHLDAGPSLLYGLWNTSSSRLGPAADPGWIQVHLSLDPGFGILLATNLTAEDATVAGNFSFVPTSPNGTLTTELPPPPASEPYIFEGWADGFDPSQASVSGNGSGNVSLTLSTDPAAVDSPLYLNGDAEVAAFGVAGIGGTSYSNVTSTLTIRDRAVAPAAPFRQLNDYWYPMFVFFAAQNLVTTSVDLDAVAPGAASSNLSWYGVPEVVPSLTDGYYFYQVNGHSEVQNVDLNGSRLLIGTFTLDPDAPAIEFYASRGSEASNVSVVSTLGIVVVDSNDTRVTDVGAVGGTGVYLLQDQDSEITNLSPVAGGAGVQVDVSNGTWVEGVGVGGFGTGVLANDSQNLTVEDLLAVGFASAITGTYLENVTLENWTDEGFGGSLEVGSRLWLRNLTSYSPYPLFVGGWSDLWGTNLSAAGHMASVLDVSTSENGSFWNVTATHGANALEGFWEDRDLHFHNLTGLVGGNAVEGFTLSTDSTFENISAGGQGAGFEGGLSDSDLRFSNVLSQGGSEAVGGTNLSNVDLWNGTAESQSMVLILFYSQDVAVSGVHAVNGSVGVSLADVNEVYLSDLTATNLSVGASWWGGTGGGLTNSTAVDNSTVAQLVGLFNVSVTYLNETNPKAGPQYFQNPFLGIIYPDGPLQTYVDTNLSVAHVTAVNCSFVLLDWYSIGLEISDVRSWGEGTAIQLNGTQFVTIDRLFAASDAHGLVTYGASNVTLVESTIEDSTSYGVYILDARNDTIYGNNFVANDGASATGSYDPAHVQLWLGLGTAMNFTWDRVGNYWSDWPGGAPYPIAGGVYDTAPAPAFIGTWLDFVAVGLTPGVRWGVAVGSHAYTASAPLIAIPSWILPPGTYAYAVTPPVSWGVDPRTGMVAFEGSNLTVDVQCTLPEYSVQFVERGLPSGTAWNVALAGLTAADVTTSVGGAVSFVEPNGTYSVSAGTVPGYYQGAVAPGSELTVDGANVTVTLDFQVEVYPITFTENFLPLGMNWSVTVDSASFSSTNSSIVLFEPNGTYSYVLGGLPGWHESALPYHGTFVVAGGSVVLAVAFFPVRYPVTFSEEGLPNGTEWSVTFDGQTLSSSATTISFLARNGTYAFDVGTTLTTLFAPEPSRGNLTLNGTSASLVVPFSPLEIHGSTGGGSSDLAWLAVGLGGGAAAGIVALGLVRRRARPPSGEEAPGAGDLGEAELLPLREPPMG